MTNRRLARESALEVLYRFDLVGDEPEHTMAEILLRRNPSEDAEAYLRRLIDTTLGNLQEIDTALRRHLARWSLERLTVLDRAILRLAAAEILYFDDVPPKVSINEAVDIAKKYGDDEAGKFVNGVLDSVYQETDRAALP